MSHTSEEGSFEDFLSSGSEYVPDYEVKKRNLLQSVSSNSSLESENSGHENRLSFLKAKGVAGVKRLFPEIGEHSSSANKNFQDIIPEDHGSIVKTDQNDNNTYCAENRIVNYTDSETSESSSEKTPMKDKTKYKTRKRKRNISLRKSNQRKEKYQKGQSYINTKGELKPAKQIDENKLCVESCRFQCRKKFTTELREEIKKYYYSMDQNEKNYFLLNNTKRVLIKRKRSSVTNYRSFTFEYFFEKANEKLRVCKSFFLTTLCVSQKPVYNVHLKKSDAGTPQRDQRGKYTKDRISQESKDEIRQHIEAFPHVESHYCRADSKKQYLDPLLNINKMYDLYVEYCLEKQIPPQSVSLYRHIFNYEYNLDFLKPKSDRCDFCEEYKIAQRENRMSEELELSNRQHILKKNLMRTEREQDGKNTDKNCAVVCFDLQNVINVPKSDVSVLFYKQKMNIYNLTAYNSTDKQCYCAVWSETTCGRSGNDLASALMQILEKVVSNNPNITEIITWSDSCVPQNRNSLISLAVAKFLQRYQHIKQITLKYSLPGHSCIQIVDNIHSRIEKFMRVQDIWSPLAFIKLLLKTDRKKPFCILNMKPKHFFDYKKSTDRLNYGNVPYSKVCQLKFLQGSPFEVQYKMEYHSSQFIKTDVKKEVKTRKVRKEKITSKELNMDASFNIEPVKNFKAKSFTNKKIESIEFAYKWMPLEDKTYMKAIISDSKKQN